MFTDLRDKTALTPTDFNPVKVDVSKNTRILTIYCESDPQKRIRSKTSSIHPNSPSSSVTQVSHVAKQVLGPLGTEKVTLFNALGCLGALVISASGLLHLIAGVIQSIFHAYPTMLTRYDPFFFGGGYATI